MTAPPALARKAPPGRTDSLAPTVLAGVVGTLTGFVSAFAVVLAGLTAVGASPAQAASGLFGLCVAQGILGVIFSCWLRLPLTFAWSLPGAAVLVAARGSTGSYGAAIGAFLLCAGLTVLAGALPGVAARLAAIPAPLTGALLAGVLLPLCLAPLTAARHHFWGTALVVGVWAVGRRFAGRWAVALAMLTAIALTLPAIGPAPASWWPTVRLVRPELDPLVAISLGVPLFVVTMAGQNVPGLAVLNGLGYLDVPLRRVLVSTGLASAAAALAGSHAVNLSAVAAAISAGPQAHPDPRRRWVAALAGGITYLLLGLTAGAVVSLLAAASPAYIEAAAGLALLGALVGGIRSALSERPSWPAAVVTFAVVVSGLTLFGLGSAVWGLVAGGLVLAVTSPRPRAQAD